MTDKQPEAYAVPLHELLVKVPRNQRLEIEFDEGYGTSYILVGRYCHEAAAELRRLHEVNAELVEALQQAVKWGQPFKDAPRDSRPEWFGMANAALAKAQGDNNE